jgi:hypothetical protein
MLFVIGALKDAEDETRKALEELCHPANRGSNPSALTRSLSAVIYALVRRLIE